MNGSLLESNSWLELRIIMKLEGNVTWKTKLTVYHQTLLALIPILNDRELIDVFFFTQYGPCEYTQNEPTANYIRKIQEPISHKVSYIKIRVHPLEEHREELTRQITSLLESQDQVIDFEILGEYNVMSDLGHRYGRRDNGVIDDEATINFVRYWDAGCRYLLSVITGPSGFSQNVDIWGVPHLIYNAIGSYLRISEMCPRCGGRQWLVTDQIEIPENIPFNHLPAFLILCQNCDYSNIISTNI